MNNQRLFIGIMGLIGTGKTTLSTKLGEFLGCNVYYEPVVDNKLLKLFYDDMKKYGFVLQVSLLNQRFALQQKIIWGDNKDVAIQDRTIYEDKIFAKTLLEMGNMSQIEYDTYIKTFDNMTNFMKNNTILVYLDISPKKSLERIKLRGRECERSITLQYLKNLEKNYREFVDSISKTIPVICVPWEDFKSTDEVAQKIKEEYNKLKIIKTINFEK